MKFGNLTGRVVRRPGLRLPVLAVACLLAVAGGVLRPGAGAQVKPQPPTKTRPASGKSLPAAESVPDKFKASGPKEAGVAPSALACPASPPSITFGQTVSGTLQSGDCTSPLDGSFYDAYNFQGTAGQQVIITMSSTAVDSYLYLLRPSDTNLDSALAEDDDSAGRPNARISVTLPATGTYQIIANTFSPGETGAYTLTLAGGNVCNLTETPIAANTPASGALASTDCTLDDGSFYDIFTFNGTAGQQVAVSMSASFDTFLFLIGPDGEELARDDNGGGGTNSRIPAGAGLARLPQTGTYRIIANSFNPGVTGSYTVTLTVGTTACPSAVIGVDETKSGALETTDCRLPFDGSFIDVYTFTGTAGQVINISLSSTAFDAYLILLGPDGSVLQEDDNGGGGTNSRIPPSSGTLTLTASGTYTIYANSAAAGQTGAYSLTLNQATGNTCVSGVYPSVQPFTQAGGAGRFTVFAPPGCAWQATSNVPWITIGVGAPGATNPNNRVRFTVAANAGATTRTGTITVGAVIFTVTQTSASTTPTLQFASANNPAAENAASRSVTVSVSRTGDTAGAATVVYATVDNPAAVPCDPALTAERGVAYARCDYATTIDTLTFLPGETTKSFTIPLVNDVHVEGAETFQVALSNPQGATLGAQATATVTVTDDDTTASPTNPINTTAVFVRQQYLDFLSREPEPGEPWSAVVNGCPNPFNTSPGTTDPSSTCDRISVSTSFFGSPEFQLKGYFVFLYHKVSFGSAADPNYVPTYEDFAADARRVTGSSANEVFAKRNDLSEDWVNRPAFKARYDPLNNAQFVDTLLANVGATLSSPDPNSGVTRTSLVNDLTAGTKTRADVLRLIVESVEVNQKQSNHAFVAMQYYGYLRRTPEPGGYQAWLSTITQPGQGTRGMVGGFLYSAEYRLRFGPNTNN